MSGVLHPVGPEPEETYWLRRAIVAGAVLVLVIVVVALLVKSGTGSAQATAPVASPSEPAAPADEIPSGSASASAPSDSPSPSPSSSSSESASAPGSASSSASPSPSESDRARGSASPTASPSDKASSEESEPAKKKKAAPAAPVTCSPAELRATLTGDQSLKPADKATFRLSLINGTGEACRVSVTPENFELTIFSGSDRIWTTDDCRTAVPPVAKKVAAEDAVTWSVPWNGRRSAEGCKNRPEIPRPGTYVATAQLDGAKPVQLRMILRD